MPNGPRRLTPAEHGAKGGAMTKDLWSNPDRQADRDKALETRRANTARRNQAWNGASKEGTQ